MSCFDPLTGHYGVLVAGGFPFSRAAQFLDMNLGEWRQLADLEMERVGVPRLVVMDTKVFIFGGYDAYGSPQRTVEVYDFLTDNWKLAPDMDEPRAHHGAVGVPNEWLLLEP